MHFDDRVALKQVEIRDVSRTSGDEIKFRSVHNVRKVEGSGSSSRPQAFRTAGTRTISFHSAAEIGCGLFHRKGLFLRPPQSYFDGRLLQGQ